MNVYVKTLLIGVAVAGLYSPATAFAQKGAGGVIGDARLHPGSWNTQVRSRSHTPSQPMVRSTAPTTVRTETASSEVAQAPTDRRSYSYEPSQPKASAVTGGCGCGQSAVTEKTPASTAQRSTETRRSYSYDPAQVESAPTASRPANARSYRTPRSGFSIDAAMRAKGY